MDFSAKVKFFCKNIALTSHLFAQLGRLKTKSNQILFGKERPLTLNPSAAAAAPQQWGEGLLPPFPTVGEGSGMGFAKYYLVQKTFDTPRSS
ncbi:hypothetical protein ACFSR2_19700 [Emticicia soli]|uniref:Uncharacterized protein n=1 Tax=Emticicia soli TaxID=2027878 RepID=A0ABW5JAQ6_9BACT